MTSCCVGDSQCSPSDTSQSKESSRQHKIPTPYWHWTSTHWRKKKIDKKTNGEFKTTKNASNDFITEKIAGSEVVSRDTVNIRQSKVIKINILSRTANTWETKFPLPPQDTNNQSYAQSDVIDGGGWDFVPFPLPTTWLRSTFYFSTDFVERVRWRHLRQWLMFHSIPGKEEVFGSK